jgi:hypothetical protein
MRDDDGHKAMLAASKAWNRVKERQTKLWHDWTLVIGPALLKARTEAMWIAGTNQPMGKGYAQAMSGLLDEYRLSDMNETVRAHLLKIMERLSDVEEWRAKQDNARELNYPSQVWTKYQKASKQADERHQEKADQEPREKKETTKEALAKALEENEALKREIERLNAHITDLEAALETRKKRAK